MNPNRGGEGPAVNFEVPAVPAVGEEYSSGAEQTAEQPKTVESSPSRQSAPPATLPTGPAAPVMPVATSTDDAQTSATPPAKDSDRIEREWVDKAKAIISRTLDDPFIQNNEMSKVKAAYIEKRFNKKVKTDNAVG